ncbi:hypothetical protein ACLOJK_027259, partial [Asimina triloba]
CQYTAGAPKFGAPSSPKNCRPTHRRRVSDRPIRSGQKDGKNLADPKEQQATNQHRPSIRSSQRSCSGSSAATTAEIELHLSSSVHSSRHHQAKTPQPTVARSGQHQRAASFAYPISDKSMAASGTHPAFRSHPIQKPQQRPRPTLITIRIAEPHYGNHEIWPLTKQPTGASQKDDPAAATSRSCPASKQQDESHSRTPKFQSKPDSVSYLHGKHLGSVSK